MAIYYVWSAAAGSANGTSWANAYTALQTALSGKLAGDVFYVAHDHSEATATATLSTTGTLANPSKFICVDRAGTVPPVAADRRTTAQIATTTNGAITFGGVEHFDGIIFVAGNSTGAAGMSAPTGAGAYLRLDNCSLRLGSTGAGRITVGASGGGCYLEMNNTTMSFSGVAQGLDVNGLLRWRNTPSALIGTAVPTILFAAPVQRGMEIDCAGVDLSGATSGKTIFGTASSSNAARCRLVDCKLDAAVTISTVPAAPGGNEVDVIRSGSSGINYAVYRHRTAGALSQETTIVRTGGASDGTTPISWKVITTANCQYSIPFECPPIAIWNDTTGAPVTATVEGIGAALPNDDEVWLDVEYLGSGASPQGSFVNDGKANLLATAAAQTSSAAAWGGSTSPFKMAVTFTAAQAGWIYGRIKVGKASSTYYLDPLVTLS